MDEFLIKNDECAYNTRCLKIQLKAEFGDELLFSNSPGQADSITLKRTADSIIRECFENYKSSCIEAQEQIIIQTAAMLTVNDIKENVSTAKEFYPSPEDLTSENCINYLPRSLYIFLNKIATGTKKEKKVVAIGQALIQACRPRSIIAPIQIGLAAQLHHFYSSRFLIDVLNSLGVCSSYSEVMQLLKDAALHGCKDIGELLSSFLVKMRGQPSPYDQWFVRNENLAFSAILAEKGHF